MAPKAWTIWESADGSPVAWFEFRQQVSPETAGAVFGKIRRHAARASAREVACQRHDLRVLHVIASQGSYGGLYICRQVENQEVGEIVKLFVGEHPAQTDIEIACSRLRGGAGPNG